MPHYSNHTSITASISNAEGIGGPFVNKTFCENAAFVDADVYLTLGPEPPSIITRFSHCGAALDPLTSTLFKYWILHVSYAADIFSWTFFLMIASQRTSLRVLKEKKSNSPNTTRGSPDLIIGH